MPYIGRNHIAGDHTSNFKVLDDISSYTATFNGSASSIVSTSDNTIRVPEHRFLQGQRVTYTNGSSTTTITVTVGTDTVGGQSTGVFYFDGVEKPASYALKRGHTYIFDQSHSTNETYGGANHPLMVSTGSDGEHNSHGHYMTGITYKLDGATVSMMGYTSGFNAATERSMQWTVPADAPASLYYWCHHHTGQGNSYAITDGNIVGLVQDTAYFVILDTHNTIKLATTLANANTSTNINLTSLGSGSAHTLTAAFDGVNTQFKATHGGGQDARIINSSQLSIAINNVIQKPNVDASYTEGFRVVDGRKIQFKTAPTSNDVFWGNIIANTIETFDISDLKVDNFTGDGSTTTFTLSKEPPNHESVIVTIDGVTQHPNDKDTTRAYRVVASVVEFTSAPGNGTEIQVRHLGFAGASTSDVSGFYGRTGNVVLGATDDITVRSINVGTGVTIESNGQATYTGIVTALQFKGDGSELSNVISGVDLKFEGATVGTGATILNFVGFNTVTPPVSGLSTITSGQNLTIGVRSGSAVEASLTGTSFNVIARSGGNISINI